VSEFCAIQAAIVRCYGESGELDRLASSAGTFAGRVAGDELLLLAPTGEAAGLVARAESNLSRDSLVRDHTAAFAIRRVSGPAAPHWFARLSALPLPAEPPAFVQGLVAGVPAKLFMLEDEIYVLVPSPLEHVLDDRTHEDCADLGMRFGRTRELPQRFEPAMSR
jgi:hypothetical protein